MENRRKFKRFSTLTLHILFRNFEGIEKKKTNLTYVQQMTEYLTKRQKLVLSLIAHGFSNAEIAQLTDKSLRTVEGIRKSIIRKLKTSNTPEAICKAMAEGIVIYEPNKYIEVKLLLSK